VDCEVCAAYRVRLCQMRACNNSWCILETKRRTIPWWDRCCSFPKKQKLS